MQTSALFRRDIGVLGDVFDFVSHYLSKENIDPSIRFSVDLAVEEVFTNFVKYNPSGLGDIGLVLWCDERELRLTLTDFDSPPFDLTKSAEVDINQPLQERQPGGLGIHLVRELMDRIEYEHTNRESRVTLYKRLDEPCSKSQ